MRTSRHLAARLALFEAMLGDARTDADRQRIVLAIRQVRGEQKQKHRRAVRTALDRIAEEIEALNRGAA